MIRPCILVLMRRRLRPGLPRILRRNGLDFGNAVRGSLMSKPMFVTLPFLLLLMDHVLWDRLRATPWRALLEKVPLLLLAFGSIYAMGPLRDRLEAARS